MAENCTPADCSSCGENCPSRMSPQSFLEPANADSNIKKVIGIVSGKGGVGKSLITSLMAVSAARQGKKAAILDADITGPSIPKFFGITEKVYGDVKGNIIPATTKDGVKVVSVNLVLEDESGEARSSPVLSSSSGMKYAGEISTICSSICRREPAMFPLQYSSHSRSTALSLLLHRRILYH